jgi:hypothetical protein
VLQIVGTGHLSAKRNGCTFGAFEAYDRPDCRSGGVECSHSAIPSLLRKPIGSNDGGDHSDWPMR